MCWGGGVACRGEGDGGGVGGSARCLLVMVRSGGWQLQDGGGAVPVTRVCQLLE